MKPIIPQETVKLVPYIAGEQTACRIKLNTNENPYPPSPEVKKAIDNFDFSLLRRYPDGSAAKLKSSLARLEGVGEDNIFVGNGSDEVLGFSFLAFYRGGKVAFSKVTYAFYPVYCSLFNIDYTAVPLVGGDSQDINTLCTLAKESSGIVIANPNAPTSIDEPISALQAIQENCSRVLLVDEAYADFSGRESFAKKGVEFDNVVTVKTFSKSYSIAGLRVGYAVANKDLILCLEKVRDSFNSYSVNSLSQCAALAALNDSAYHSETVNKVIAARDNLASRLSALKSVTVNKSATNFLLVKNSSVNGETIYNQLKSEGILVRYFSALPDCIRVTVGTDSECDEFFNQYKKIVGVYDD